MDKKKVLKSDTKAKSQEGFQILSHAFYEASKISFSLVFFPIIILLAGVWLDKKLGTTPFFIIVGIVAGIFIGIYKATEIRKGKFIRFIKNG